MRLQLTLVLSVAMTGSAAAQDWRISADTLVYDDTDNVTVVTPQVGVKRRLGEDGGEVSARAAVDVYTCASVDVVSHATNRFDEVRTEADLGASYALGDLLPSLSYRISSEPDYLSHGFGAGLSARLGTPDSVLSATYGLTLDTIGMTGTPFDRWSQSLASHASTLSLTQNLDDQTVVRAVYTLTVQDGYMEKPYRYVPMFDASGMAAAREAGVELGLDTFDAFRLSARPPESVPDLRVRHAFAVRGLRYVEPANGSLRVDYRFYVDSWAVTAHTVEAVFLTAVAEWLTLGVHARGHFQSAASFWERTYVVQQTDAVPRWRSVDRNLSTYRTYTGGLSAETAFEPFSLYAEGAVAFTDFVNYLFLESRVAIVAQMGVRWEL